jgi:hypothetical protein
MELDAKISAYYDDGTAIFTDVDDSFTAPQTFTADRSGQVYVCVYPASRDTITNGSDVSYSLVYSTSSTMPNMPLPPDPPPVSGGETMEKAIQLTNGQWFDNSIRPANNPTWYVFNATDATTYRIWVDDKNYGGSKTANVLITAYTANGGLLNNNHDGTHADYVVITYTNKIYIKVSGATARYSGTYSIVWSDLSMIRPPKQ